MKKLIVLALAAQLSGCMWLVVPAVSTGMAVKAQQIAQQAQAAGND